VRYPVASASALFITLLAGCGHGHSRPTAIEWVDGTGSAKGDSIALCTARARAVTEQVAQRQGTAMVQRLDASTANAPTFEVAKTFDVPAEIASDADLIRQKRESDVRALYASAAPELSAPAAGGTEVVGALAASAAKLQGYSGERFIYICSDLLDHRLVKLRTLDMRSVNRLLRDMRSKGEIPSMHGTEVVLDTTSATARDHLGPSEQAAIERFYRALVKLGGGEVVAYGVGATLPLGG
jgi:hypothetical protein